MVTITANSTATTTATVSLHYIQVTNEKIQLSGRWSEINIVINLMDIPETNGRIQCSIDSKYFSSYY